MNTRIEFRCTEEEREKVREKAKREGLSVGECLLKHTIYKCGKSGLKAEEKASVCKIRTCLNKISDGIDEKENIQGILEECERLCQSLK